MDNFHALSGIVIVKCFLWVSCQFNAKSGAIDLLATPDIGQWATLEIIINATTIRLNAINEIIGA